MGWLMTVSPIDFEVYGGLFTTPAMREALSTARASSGCSTSRRRSPAHKAGSA